MSETIDGAFMHYCKLKVFDDRRKAYAMPSSCSDKQCQECSDVARIMYRAERQPANFADRWGKAFDFCNDFPNTSEPGSAPVSPRTPAKSEAAGVKAGMEPYVITREQIEECRQWLDKQGYLDKDMNALCDAALEGEFRIAVMRELAQSNLGLRAELEAIHSAVMNPQGVSIKDADTFTTKMVKEFVLASLPKSQRL